MKTALRTHQRAADGLPQGKRPAPAALRVAVHARVERFAPQAPDPNRTAIARSSLARRDGDARMTAMPNPLDRRSFVFGGLGGLGVGGGAALVAIHPVRSGITSYVRTGITSYA